MNTLFSKKLISAILAVLIILSTFTIAFADSDEPAAGFEVSSDPAPVEVTSSNVELELLAPDLRNPVYLQVAKDLKVSTASTYDLDDIYYIVQECANALVEYDGSEYVSVTEYVHACLSGLANGLFNGSSSNPYLGSINSNIASIQAAVYGPAWDGSGVTNSLWNALQTLYSVNHADQLAQMAKQQGIIDALVGNTQYSISNKLNNLLQTFNWITDNYNITFNGIFNNSNTLVTGGLTDGQIYYASFTPSSLVPNPSKIIKLTFPLGNISGNHNQNDIKFLGMYYPQVGTYYRPILGYSYDRFETTVYIEDFYGSTFYIQFVANQSYAFPNASASASYLIKDTYEYYQFYNYLNIKHIDNDMHTMSGGIDKLVRMYASDDELAAKQAQQQYEQDSLTDFTGGGSAAASGTDRNGLKSVSNTAKSGFDSGGSISDGLSVFNSNNSIWGWFSQDNASYFTTNRSLMKSNNNSELITDIPDYLSISDKYMNDNLGDNYDEPYRK